MATRSPGPIPTSIPYIILEEFGEAGTPPNCTVLNGSPVFNNPDSISGPYSAVFSGATGDVANWSFTAQNQIEAYCFLYRFGTLNNDFPCGLFNIEVGTDCAYVQLLGTSSSGVAVGVKCGTQVANTSGLLTHDVLYQIWMSYAFNSPGKNFASVGFSTNGIRPTSGANFASLSNGDANLSCDGFQLSSFVSGAHFTFDRLIIANSIGGNP
jgi:hypothetical protein